MSTSSEPQVATVTPIATLPEIFNLVGDKEKEYVNRLTRCVHNIVHPKVSDLTINNWPIIVPPMLEKLEEITRVFQ